MFYPDQIVLKIYREDFLGKHLDGSPEFKAIQRQFHGAIVDFTNETPEGTEKWKSHVILRPRAADDRSSALYGPHTLPDKELSRLLDTMFLEYSQVGYADLHHISALEYLDKLRVAFPLILVLRKR